MKKILLLIFLSNFALAEEEIPVALLGDNDQNGKNVGETLGRNLMETAKEGLPKMTELKPEEKKKENQEEQTSWNGYKAVESLAVNGNPALALKQINSRLAQFSDDTKAAYLKGLILMQMGKADEAERWFKMMIVNFPNVPQFYNALSVIYTGKKDLKAAQNILEEYVMSDNNTVSCSVVSSEVACGSNVGVAGNGLFRCLNAAFSDSS